MRFKSLSKTYILTTSVYNYINICVNQLCGHWQTKREVVSKSGWNAAAIAELGICSASGRSRGFNHDGKASRDAV